MAREKILLADDDPQILQVFGEVLEKAGYRVTAAADGNAATQAVQQERFAVALVDLILPEVSGMELLSRIKAKSPHTEVIMITGHGAMDTAIEAMRRGAYDYLLKGELHLEDLQAVVARALERRELTLMNQELRRHLAKAKKEVSAQHQADLSRVRRIGEALAVPLTWEQLFHGLLNLVWETFSLRVLGMELQGARKEISLASYRRQPGVKDAVLKEFKGWLKEHFQHHAASPSRGGDPAPPKPPLPQCPLPYALPECLRHAGVVAMVAAAREAPFTPEEVELFRIFMLQGEAAIKNLMLFEEVKSLAIRDGLTGLYNYRHFWEILQKQVEQGRRYQRPLSLMFLDLDNFKLINDTLGHTSGDVVLKTVAAYLQGALRQADVVCRYGGEEFVALLPQTPLKPALALAERLRRRIAQMVIALAEQDIQITVSIGVAGLEPGMNGEDLVDAADAAMYRAKQAGKNQVAGPLEAVSS